MEQQKQKLKMKDCYTGHLILREFTADGVSKKLIIPVELAKESHDRINRFYEIGSWRELDQPRVFMEKLEDLLYKEIAQQLKTGERYFTAHPDKWVHLLKPVKITHKDIMTRLAIHKMKGINSKYSS